MDGIILAKAFNRYLLGAQGKTYVAVLPKTLKRDYNPWPGDFAVFDAGTQVISEVKPPRNVIERPHIANLDQLFVVMSVGEPPFSWPLVYRYLSYAYHHDVTPYLVISKIDRQTEPFSESFARQLLELNIPVIYVGKNRHEGLEDIRRLIPGKISAFAGQTGVGKSTILNALSGEFRQTIGSYSKALGRGRHETKQVQLFPYLDGYIADTPGFSSLELALGKQDLAVCFPSIGAYRHLCRFPNCLHLGESGCEITKRVKNGKMALETYQAYVELSATLPFRKDNY